MICKNCQTSLSHESDYCNSCGAKVIRNRLTLRNLFEHASETFFNYDNKLLRTYLRLFSAPEDVIGSYINGVRKKYVNPISYFGLALTLSGLYILIINKFYPEAMDFSIMSAPGQEEFQKRNVSFVQEYQSIFMMFYVPIYALMGLISFIGLKRYNYTELIVVFTYIQAQTSITTAVIIVIASMFGITHGVASLVLLPLMLFYTAFCLKRLYKISILTIILRTLLFLVVLGVVMLIAGVVMLITMYFNGDLHEMIESQKAVIEAAKQ